MTYPATAFPTLRAVMKKGINRPSNGKRRLANSSLSLEHTFSSASRKNNKSTILKQRIKRPPPRRPSLFHPMPPDFLKKTTIRERVVFACLLLVLVAVCLFLSNARGLHTEALPSHDTLATLSGYLIFSKHLHQFGDVPLWRPYSTFGAPMDWLQLLLLAPTTCAFSLIGAAGFGDHLVDVFKISLLFEQILFAGACCWLAALIFKSRLATILFVCSSLLSSGVWAQVYFNFRWVAGLPWIVIFLLLAFRKESRPLLLFSLVFVLISVYGSPFYSVFPYAMFWVCTFLSLYFCAEKVDEKNWLIAGIPRRELAWLLTTAGALALLTIVVFTQMLLVKVYQTPVSMGRDGDGLITLESFLSYGTTFTPSKLYQHFSFGSPFPFELSLFLGLPLLVLAFVGLFNREIASKIFRNQSALFFVFCISGIFTMAVYYLPGFNHFRHVGYTSVFLRFSLCALAGFGLQQLLENLPDSQQDRDSRPAKLAMYAIIGGLALLSFLESGIPLSPSDALTDFGLRLSLEGAALILLILLLMRLKVRFPFAAPALLTGIPITMLALANWETQKDTALSDPKLAPFHAALSSPITAIMDRSTKHPELKDTFENTWTRRTMFYDMLDSAINVEDPIKRRYDLLPSDTAMVFKYVNGNTPLFRKLSFAGQPKVFLAAPAKPAAGERNIFPLADRETLFLRPLEKSGISEGGLKLENFSFNEVSFHVPAADEKSPQAKRYLIYADAYHPEWNAEVNGKPVPVLRASAMFKAVLLDEGTNTVRFSFGSPLRHLSAWVNFITCIGIFLLQAGLLIVVACRHILAPMSKPSITA